MKALLASAEVILFAGFLCSCSHVSLDSVRTTYLDSAAPTVPGMPPAPPKLDITCRTFQGSDEADMTSKMKSMYDLSWRIAATGSRNGDLLVCFERPAGIVDPARPHAKAHKAAAAPPPSDDTSADSDVPAAPRPARHRPALDADTPAPDDSAAAAPAAAAPASDDSSSDTPPPKSKRRRPSPPPDDSGN